MHAPQLLLKMLGLFHLFYTIPQVFVLLTLTEDFYEQLCLSQMSVKNALFLSQNDPASPVFVLPFTGSRLNKLCSTMGETHDKNL